MRLPIRTLPVFCLLALASAPAAAQRASQATASPAENVRLDYAHVLKVEPVYETLRASRTEMQCEEVPPARATPAREPEEEGRWSKLVETVKGAFSSDTPREPQVPVPQAKPECRLVPVQREFRRPIAYDVDYVYRGMQYRSRLPEDPGNRLRIRISVMPHLGGQGASAP